MSDTDIEAPHPDAREVRDPETGDLLGWSVPSPAGSGRLFRALPGKAHPNHRPGPGLTRRSVREKLLRLTDYGVDALARSLEEGVLCPACGERHKDKLTAARLLALVEKGGKLSLGSPADDDDGRPIASPVVVLPPLD